jgi:hypothetical protein
MTSVGAHAVRTGRQDENVTDYAANRMGRIASDSGGDDMVADVRAELDRPAVIDAARVGISCGSAGTSRPLTRGAIRMPSGLREPVTDGGVNRRQRQVATRGVPP